MLLLATFFAFTACSSDDEENTITKEQLIGIWDATEVQFNNDGKWIDITNHPDLALSIYLYEDNTYYGRGALGDGDGTYILSGNIIKTYVDGKLYGEYILKSLNGNKAELTLTIEGEKMDIRATKSKIKLGPNDPSIITDNYDENPTTRSYWENETLDGKHFVYQTLNVYPYDLTWNVRDYTIDEKGNYIFEVNGNEVRGKLNKIETKYYRYSFDGKTLVLRDDIIIYTDFGKIQPSYKEYVFSASVNENKLSISDENNITVYSKVVSNIEFPNDL